MRFAQGDTVTINAEHDTFHAQLGVITDQVIDERVPEALFRVLVGDREFLYEESALAPTAATATVATARRIARTSQHPYRPYANALLEGREFRERVTELGWSTAPRLIASRLAKVQGVRPCGC